MTRSLRPATGSQRRATTSWATSFSKHVAEEKVDEAAIRKMYEAQIAAARSSWSDEAHVRHILAPTKEAIDKIAAELKAGAEFTVLAAQAFDRRGHPHGWRRPRLHDGRRMRRRNSPR